MLFTIENVKENTMYFLIKVKNLPEILIVKQLLVELIQFLGAFYNLLIILERLEHFLLDVCSYAQDGLNYTLSYFF